MRDKVCRGCMCLMQQFSCFYVMKDLSLNIVKIYDIIIKCVNNTSLTMSSGDKCQICEKELGDNEELIIAVKTQNGRCYYYFLFF